MNDKAPVMLVEEKEALNLYLEALLREPMEETAPIEAPAVETAPVEAPAVVDAPPKVAQAVAPAPAVQANDMPAWGEAPFQVLLFRVAGLTLAVPLVKLSGVQEWFGEKVTPMPGHSESYLGLVSYRERNNVPVVDTACFVLPEDRLPRLGPASERIRRVVFIADGRWGLACDELAQVVRLEPDQVRWRSSRTKRRWLAGTVIDHMCALIDPPAFAEMLATGIEDAPQGGSEPTPELPAADDGNEDER